MTRKECPETGDEGNVDETFLQDPNSQPTMVPQSDDDTHESIDQPKDAPGPTEIGAPVPDAVTEREEPPMQPARGRSPVPEGPTVVGMPESDADTAATMDGDSSSVMGTMAHQSAIRQSDGQRGSAPGAVGGMIGDYRIDAELGRGGMGVVYKAHHTRLRRDVALKMILSGQHAGADAIERFLLEARAVAHLQHPNIVQIFDIGEHDGLPFFSLEFVEGQGLDVLLAGKPQTAEDSATMVETLARAMQYAHDHGILHRDIKPANVLVATDGTPKIADFGLAKQVEDTDSGSTRTGTIMGSPSYMSPEQAGGKTHEIGPAADQYSIGALLYQMLTGRPPFMAAKAFDTVMQVINNDPVPPRQLQSEIPVDLETICLKALEKDQTRRYSSCEELASDLRRYLNGEPIEARAVSKAERVWRWCKRNPRIAVPSALAVLLLFATAAISTASYLKVSEQAVELKRERDNAITQEQRAKAATTLAVQREEDARQQAQLALESMQFVLTEIDKKLQTQPGAEELRKGLMVGLLDQFAKLKVGLTRNGVAGEGIPTLMAMQMSLATTLLGLGELERASDILDELIDMGRERLRVKGRNDAARTNLARILVQKAHVRSKIDRDVNETLQLRNEALQLVQETIDEPNQTGPDGPTWLDVHELLGAVHQGIGVDYLHQGNMQAAALAFEQSLKASGDVLQHIRSQPGFDELAPGAKDQQTYMKQLNYDKAALGLAYIMLRLGQTEKALPLYEEAIGGRREIADRYPLDKNPGFLSLHQALAGFLGNYGNSLLWVDRPEQAELPLTESLQRAEEAFAISPKDVDLKQLVATAHYRLGTLHDLQGQSEAAAADFEASRRLRKELVETTNSEKHRIELMLALARCGDVTGAAKLADEFGAPEHTDAEHHLQRARCYAQLTRVVSPEEVERYRVAGLDALERAADAGYGDPFRVRAENDLDPLHDDPRFEAIVARISTDATPTP